MLWDNDNIRSRLIRGQKLTGGRQDSGAENVQYSEQVNEKSQAG